MDQRTLHVGWWNDTIALIGERTAAAASRHGESRATAPAGDGARAKSGRAPIAATRAPAGPTA